MGREANVYFTNLAMPFMFLVSHGTIKTTGNAGATMDLISSTMMMGGQKARMHHRNKLVKVKVGAIRLLKESLRLS